MYFSRNSRRINFVGLVMILIAIALHPVTSVAQIQQGVLGPIASPRPLTNDPETDKTINTVITPGENYYSVRVVGAAINVPSRGVLARTFARASQVTMTSSANVQGAADVVPTRGINWVQQISPGRQYALGVRPFLVDYMPAVGTSLALTVEFRVLEEGPATKTLAKMSSFINTQQQPLGSALRMGVTEASGLGSVAAVSAIASQLIGSVFPEESEKTTLKFNAEWALRNGLKTSYYFILAAYDKQELASYDVVTKLKVKPVGSPDSGQAVLVDEDGDEFIDNSYVIFEVSAYPKLGKVYSPDWLDMYASATDKAQLFKNLNAQPTQQQRNEAYAICEGLVNQAKAFADRDKRYLHGEKDAHYKATIASCRSIILGIASQ